MQTINVNMAAALLARAGTLLKFSAATIRTADPTTATTFARSLVPVLNAMHRVSPSICMTYAIWLTPCEYLTIMAQTPARHRKATTFPA